MPTPEPLDLPAGPVVAHLQAMRALYGEALSAVRAITGSDGDVTTRQEAMDHHLREVARFTAPTYGIDFPPRPTMGEDEDGYPTLPDGWASVVTGVDTEAEGSPIVVLCGWTTAGTFVQYASTEQIVTVCTQALEGLTRG